MKLVIISSGILLLLFTGCKKKVPEAEVLEHGQSQSIGAPVDRPKLTLPTQRTIIGKDGRKLEVMIVQRTADFIKIVRNSDQKTFDLAISKLSDVDQGFVKKLPLSNLDSLRLKNRQKELRKLEETMRDYEDELNSEILNRSHSSVVRGKMKRLLSEIVKLKQNIQKLKRDS